MRILRKRKVRAFLSENLRRINTVLLVFFLAILTGCSALSSYVFFVPQEKDSLFHDVERSDWVTTNQGYGAVRPPLRSININGQGQLIIYPIRSSGDIETFGPPFLPIIWIPKFMYLPPSTPLNILHLICTGNPDDVCIESIDDMLINQDLLKIKMREGETHFYVSIPDRIAEKETLTANISVGGNVMYLKFNKSRSTNWFPLFVPL
jgi:hypothetical protein